MEKKKFSELFVERLKAIEVAADERGISLSAICRGARIARATPDRWHLKIPRTIEIIDDMEAALEKETRKKEKKK